MGPEVEWARQSPDAPIELRVYRGADARFTLYEDQVDTYDYEKGARAVIPMKWDDAAQTLTIGAQVGSYPGMPEKREFKVVFVGDGHGAGGAVTGNPDRSVEYSGASLTVSAL
jgi:alpha-D-xyloside xylohydrolase